MQSLTVEVQIFPKKFATATASVPWAPARLLQPWAPTHTSKVVSLRLNNASKRSVLLNDLKWSTARCNKTSNLQEIHFLFSRAVRLTTKVDSGLRGNQTSSNDTFLKFWPVDPENCFSLSQQSASKTLRPRGHDPRLKVLLF